MSGIEVEPEVTSVFNDMKVRSSDKFITFKILEKKKIIIDHRSGPKITEEKDKDEEAFQELVALLKDEPRYILYDFGFKDSQMKKIRRMAFIFWYVELSKSQNGFLNENTYTPSLHLVPFC